jgi:peptidoglycan/LPS O-acetylase OafA/YrhL
LNRRRRICARENYRPEIDGLRSLAISTVALFHAAPQIARSGLVLTTASPRGHSGGSRLDKLGPTADGVERLSNSR